MQVFYKSACVYSTVFETPHSHSIKLFQFRLDKNKSTLSCWPLSVPSPVAKLSGLISSTQDVRLAHIQYAQEGISEFVCAFTPMNSSKLIQNLFFIFFFQRKVQSGFSTSSEAEVCQHIFMCVSFSVCVFQSDVRDCLLRCALKSCD